VRALAITNARVLTMGGPGPHRGGAMAELGVVERGSVVVEDGRVVEVTHGRPPTADVVIDARGRVLMPAFVDCHTHACWAGDRLDEWEMKLEGATYLELLKAGGGIMSTVRAVRAAGEDELVAHLRARLGWMLREGTCAVEVKSGYGLTTHDELKMLRAARRAAEGWPGEVAITACVGHALDPDVDRDAFVRTTIEETLPAVSAEFPGIAVDAYCEEGAWSLDECVGLFERAIGLGHPVRVHTDQFNALGMTEWAVDHGAATVDHLEATAREGLEGVAGSGTIAVLLPCSGFQTDDRYADGRTLIDARGAVAVATNSNPGSAPTGSVPMAVALACRKNGLTPAEAICAVTANAAAALGMEDRGFIAPGARADLVVLRHADERMLGFEFGGDPVDVVVCGGAVIKGWV
jgi:imidazolonepropionase